MTIGLLHEGYQSAITRQVRHFRDRDVQQVVMHNGFYDDDLEFVQLEHVQHLRPPWDVIPLRHD